MQPTILLVDDTPSMRHMLRRAIRHGHPGAIILEAATVQDALQLFATHHIATLITDYHLPDGDGLQIVRAARLRDPAMRIFMVSADVSIGPQARALGATFFAKPLDLHEFLAVFGRWRNAA